MGSEMCIRDSFKLNLKTKEIEFVERDPDNRVDFGGLRVDRNTREIISTSYTNDKTRRYWHNKTRETHYTFLNKSFSGREIAYQSSTKDYSKFLISVHGDRYAAECWYYDTETRKLIRQYTLRPELKEVQDHLAPMTPIHYASRDGLQIPAYLTVPAGVEAKDLPVVVLVHGGPKGPRDYWGYSAQVQFCLLYTSPSPRDS